MSVWNRLGDTAGPPQSVTKNSQTIVTVWRPTGSASSLSGVFPGSRGGEVAEPSSAEVVCHAGSEASPFGTLIR